MKYTLRAGFASAAIFFTLNLGAVANAFPDKSVRLTVGFGLAGHLASRRASCKNDLPL